MLEMVAHSRKLMRAEGNSVQWVAGYPGKEALLNDIEHGHSHIIEDDDRPVGTFALVYGIEPTYSYIEGGEWIDDTTPYATIHRLARAEGAKGIGRDCFEWCLGKVASLRADTHESNAAMRHIIESCGLSYCGIVYMGDGTQRMAFQKMTYPMVQKGLKNYAETHLLPLYNNFDTAHRRDHAERVMAHSMELASHYPETNCDMVYTVAVYHDLGLAQGREQHHLVSGTLLRENNELKRWFSDIDIETMAQAVEDHRASAQHEPRSLYGRIVAEADRDIEPLRIVQRTVEYGLCNMPELDKEEQWQRCVDHLQEKYGEGGYLKLWLPESKNAKNLKLLRDLIANKEKLNSVFEQLYHNANAN